MKPKQFFLVLLGVIAALLVATGGGYYWALQQMKQRTTVLATDLVAQSAADSEYAYLGKLKREYDRNIVPILPMLDEDLPRDKKQTEILAQLQTLAAQAGLQIGAINMPSPAGLPTGISQTIKAGNVLALPISFQLSGSYDQLQNFTAKVEGLNRFTNITNLAISHSDKSKPIVYTIALNAYIKP
ncbi:MAG TPA: type 4a pilus biogenesis protein PilO [Candidatus Saccharimonadia bacterium]|jgi:Tfp pilus assembly protein PilO|nr:type 4a pilus biogenesis protein PilO [Candidatus Saccharimonadia bacterium]